MANFKALVRNQRRDGFWHVIIRVTHNRTLGYIKTGKMVGPKDVTKTKDIKDPVVLKYCSELIMEYQQLLNGKEISEWDVKQVIEFLTKEGQEINFTRYALNHIFKMEDVGQERNARNYKMALTSLQLFLGTKNIMFSQLTSATVNRWIKELSETTRRAKEMYPICIRQIFKAAMLDYNDYDAGIIRIKTNPWPKVKIPKADRAEKKAISAEACREFFSAPLPPTKMIDAKAEFGRDIAKLVLCLGGINAVDLYNLKKADYKNGLICYKRAKTKKARADEAYIEMRVEPIIYPLFEKYATPADDPYLFNFHSRYKTSDSLNSNANGGIKDICEFMGIPKQKQYCVYTFRHTWGTIAQNDCDATIDEVAFAMNHSRGHNVTRGYLKLDFTPAWILNKKVIDFIFFSNKRSKQGHAREVDEPQGKLFRISPKMMVYARAYYKGEVLAELQDIGFGTVDEVVKALATKLPDSIPDRAIVSFRIKNVDSDNEVVYEHMKGKGF